MKTIKEMIKETEKGCGEEFIYNIYLNEIRICGRIEDLKHSEHIIYCPICQAKLEALKQAQQSFIEMIEKIDKELLKYWDKARKENDKYFEDMCWHSHDKLQELKQWVEE